MPYGWQVKLNGVDISDKVSGFTITCALDSYCREMSLDIADPDLYAELDFGQISETPEIEILTKTGASYISQGTFFIERPAIAATVDSDLMSGVWGRSLTAKLGEPFAPKVAKTWETQTTFFGICEEMCNLAGLTWDPAYSVIVDFVVFPYTYAADGVYPIDVITELAELAGALVTTDRLGHLCIKQIDYAPSAADVTIVDIDIAGITESPEWPAFGNRISITPSGSVSGYKIELIVADECLAADGESRTRLFAQVTDADDLPVNGMVVSWAIDSASAALSRATSNTQEILIQNERQKASNFYMVSVDFNPSSVAGIWAAADTAKSINLAAAGYAIDGNEITLTGKLVYCNQSLVISYYSEGMAVNYLTAGDIAEDVIVTAGIEGEEDTGVVYIDNPCQCPPTIILTAAPTSITVGNTSDLLVYVEESGPVTAGRYVFMAHTSATKRGVLNWTYARLGTVSITNEQTTAINEISGLTQCGISMYPVSVSAVYLSDEAGEPYGENLYVSHSGKTITLSALETGTDLLVDYVAWGAALNQFRGVLLGSAVVKAWIKSTLEEGIEAEANINIGNNSTTTDDYPSDWVYNTNVGGDAYYNSAGSPILPEEVIEVPLEEEEEEENDGTDGGSGGKGGGVGGSFNPSKEDPLPVQDESSGGALPGCVSTNVSADPNPDALAGRFATGFETDCSCTEMCDNEYYIYKTTQNYDGASGRSTSEIVIQDSGLVAGSPEYWEKHAEVKQEALSSCMEQCDEQDPCKNVPTWSEENSETSGQSASTLIGVAGGKGPFTWNVSGTGFTLEANETEEGINSLIADETSCGSATISVTDSCGNTVTGYVRSTVGQWVIVDLCVIAGGGCPCGVVAGKTMLLSWWRIEDETGECPGGGGCGAALCADCIPVGEHISVCCKTTTYEWQC